MYLTLPLPIQKKWKHAIYYVPWDLEKPHVKVRKLSLTFCISANGSSSPRFPLKLTETRLSKISGFSLVAGWIPLRIMFVLGYLNLSPLNL
jgi:hypothetical protein